MRTVRLKPHPEADSRLKASLLLIIGAALSLISAGTGAAPAALASSIGPDPSNNVIPTYLLSATTAGGGIVSANPSSPSYLSNTVVSITAGAGNGWRFLGWSGDASGTAVTVQVTMTDNKCVQAVFGTSLNTTITGDGYVVVSPTTTTYPYGSVVQLSALPFPSNYFSIWAIAANSTTNPLSFVMTNANPSISALFNPLAAGQFSLTVIPSGAGNITYTPHLDRFTNGQLVTVTATPDPGQDFIGWTGNAAGTDNPLAVTMSQSKVIYANFSKRPRLVVGPCDGQPSGSEFRLTLVGQLDARYQLEGSTDLASWTPLVTLTNSLGLSQFSDSSNTNLPRRFYRALLLP